VRSLHKYVLSALRNKAGGDNKRGSEYSSSDLYAGKQGATQNRKQRRKATELADRMAPGGRTIVDPPPEPPQSSGLGKDSLMSIYESEVLLPDQTSPSNENFTSREGRENVTYRERLGGYLHPRDMRRLVNPFSASNESEVIVRRHAILLNFDPLRAIILRDRLLVLVPDGADSILVQLEKRLRGGLDMEKYMIDGTELDGTEKIQRADKKEEKSLAHRASSGAETDDSTTENTNVEAVAGEPDLNGKVENVHTDQELLDAFVENEWNELEGRDWIDLPFELQCVDAVLSSVSAILAEDVLELQHDANSMIVQFLEPGSDVGDYSQEILRQMKNSVLEMISRVDGYCRAMDDLLEDDEDMALMNLSRLLTHPERFIQPVPQSILDEESDEPELIVEAHLQRGHTLANALRLVQGQVTSTEDFAERKSDTIRNQLLFINLLLQTMALAVAVGSFIGAIFGMNVLNGYEESHKVFVAIFASTCAFMVIVPIVMIFVIRRMGIVPRLF
jgi:magnesium transporter